MQQGEHRFHRASCPTGHDPVDLKANASGVPATAAGEQPATGPARQLTPLDGTGDPAMMPALSSALNLLAGSCRARQQHQCSIVRQSTRPATLMPRRLRCRVCRTASENSNSFFVGKQRAAAGGGNEGDQIEGGLRPCFSRSQNGRRGTTRWRRRPRTATFRPPWMTCNGANPTSNVSARRDGSALAGAVAGESCRP